MRCDATIPMCVNSSSVTERGASMPMTQTVTGALHHRQELNSAWCEKGVSTMHVGRAASHVASLCMDKTAS